MHSEPWRNFLAENVLTTAEVAERFGVTRQHVSLLTRKGELTAFKDYPNQFLYALTDVINYQRRSLSNHPRQPKWFGQGNTFRSLDFFEEHKQEIGRVVSAYAYFEDIAAAAEGYYLPDGIYHGEGEFESVVVPHLVLRNELGEEMWLEGCSCGYGGRGPRGTQKVLLELGFDKEKLSKIFSSSVVKFAKDIDQSETEVYEREDPFRDRISTDSRALLRMWKGSLILLQDVEQWGDNNSRLMLDRYKTFLPEPMEFVVLSREEAETSGFVYETFWKREVYQVIIKDLSGRQIWLSPAIRDIYSKKELTELTQLLEMCGFDASKLEAESHWLKRLLRRGNVSSFVISKDKPF